MMNNLQQRLLKNDLMLNRINRLKRRYNTETIPQALSDFDKQSLKTIAKIEDEIKAQSWQEEIKEILRLAGVSYELERNGWYELRNKLRKEAEQDVFADTTKSSSDEKRT